MLDATSSQNFIKLHTLATEYIPPKTILNSGPMYPCSSVIIYNNVTKDAFAGHFCHCESGRLETMLKKTKSKFSGSELLIFVVGNSVNSLSNKRLQEYTLEDRTFVPKILEKYNFSKSETIFRWSPPNCYAIFEMNTETSQTNLKIHYLEKDILLYEGEIRECPIF